MNDLTPQSTATHPMVQFKRDMEAMVLKELDMLDEKSKSRMKSAAIVAVTKDPELLHADRQSFMGAIRMCAQHGVIPDGNEATLQAYNTKVKGPNGQDIWIKKVTYLPMIRGIVNRVLRSGKIKLFYAETVYADETFKIDTTHGDRRPFHDYDPMRRGKDSDIIGVYSVAVWQDGTTDCEPMPREQIEKVKAIAKTKNVWDGWYSEKAKVAVMKRHTKRLPLSAEDMEFILNRDETDFDHSPRDVTPEPQGPRQNLAQRLQRPAQEPVSIDGEVLPPEDEATPSAASPEVHWTDDVTEGGCPGSAAWDRGIAAAEEGLPKSSIPYDQGTEEAADWLGGYINKLRTME